MQKDLKSVLVEQAAQIIQLVIDKNQNYSGNGWFDNFEQAAQMIGVSADKCLAHEINKKVIRLNNVLRKSSIPLQNRDIVIESLTDIIGGALLFLCYYSTRQNEKELNREVANRSGKHDWLEMIRSMARGHDKASAANRRADR
ncbi:MAG: hypothetical protein V2G41_09705 [bacterium JZ-2024 1]